jgi:hypothetical protein
MCFIALKCLRGVFGRTASFVCSPLILVSNQTAYYCHMGGLNLDLVCFIVTCEAN